MLIVLDAGHGGSDPGAVYNGRQEKDDNLRLALAVGDILKSRGIDVVYTRTDDIYETPFKKATDGNNAGADYFISFHRNSSETPNNASGVQNLIYSKGGRSEEIAEDIQENLVNLGFRDLGIVERPNLVVLRRTAMPSVLIETGFINNDADNRKFDDEFDAIANAIADGIIEGTGFRGTAVEENPDTAPWNSMYREGEHIPDPYDGFLDENNEEIIDGRDMDDNQDNEEPEKCVCDRLYRIQTGAFRNRENAERLLSSLTEQGFPAFIVFDDDGLYKVQVGAYRNLDNAVRMERRLRRFRYNTFITV